MNKMIISESLFSGEAVPFIKDSVFRTKDGLVLRCPYCLGVAKIVSGNTVYPKTPAAWNSQFYFCQPCEAWVGVHRETSLPLGRLANAELRKLRIQAHRAFDPLWQEKKNKKAARDAAYKWLAWRMKMLTEICHIGFMTAPQCRRAIEILANYRSDFETRFTRGKASSFASELFQR